MTRMAHALVGPMTFEEGRRMHRAWDIQAEPGIAAAVASLGQYVTFNPTCATPGENLPEYLVRSSTRFLLNMQAIEVRLNQEKVKSEMEYFQHCVVIAYFVGSQPTTKAMQAWIGQLKIEVKGEVHLG